MELDVTLPLVFGLLSLIALHLMVVRGQAPRRRTVALFVAGLAAGTVAMGWWLAPPRYVPDASTSALAVEVADDIRRGLRRGEAGGFVILDGGSFSARGVDDEMLERSLAAGLDSPPTVLTLSLAGGNQLERWSVLRRAIALLTREERERFLAAPMVLLLEIHAQYDRYPLVQLRRNRGSDRAYAYLDMPTLREAFRADHGDRDLDHRLQQWGDVARHVAVNLANAGLATRVVPPDEVEGQGGYVPLERSSRGYRFPGTKAVRQHLKQPVQMEEELPWRNIELRRDRYARVLGDRPRVIYFSVPTPREFDLDYARGFCAAVTDYPCIAHDHWTLLHRLDDAGLWYDNGHMQRGGAEIYTPWLSRRVVDVLQQEVRS